MIVRLSHANRHWRSVNSTRAASNSVFHGAKSSMLERAVCSERNATFAEAQSRAPAMVPSGVIPATMSPALLAAAAASAVKEGNSTPRFWNSVACRAKQVSTKFLPQEVATLFSAYSKSRAGNPDMFVPFFQHIIGNLSHYTQSQLGMILSALAKVQLRPQPFLTIILGEVRRRVHELQSPVELSMLVCALVKLKIDETHIFTRLNGQIRSRLLGTRFHIRDLSVMASACSRADAFPLALFDLISEQSLPQLRDATLLDLARLMSASSRIGHSSSVLIAETAMPHAFRQLVALQPTDIVSVAFAYGEIRQLMDVNRRSLLDDFFIELQRVSIATLTLFSCSQIANVLQSLARWKIAVPSSNIVRYCDRLYQLGPSRIGRDVRVKLCHSLGLIASQWTSGSSIITGSNVEVAGLTRENLECRGKIQDSRLMLSPQCESLLGASKALKVLFSTWGDTFAAEVISEQLTLAEATQIIRSYSFVRIECITVLEAVKNQLVWRHSELDATTAFQLRQIFLLNGYHHDDDCLLALSDY